MRNSDELFKKYLEDSFGKTDLGRTMSDLNNFKNKVEGKESYDKLNLTNTKSFNNLMKKHKSFTKSPKQLEKILKNQLKKGVKVEMEHTKDKRVAEKIALDHLYEDPEYYSKLSKIESKEATTTGSAGSFEPLFSGEEPQKVETKEATTSASVGAYETPAAWAKSTSKKHWRGKSKTQIPGGSFVAVKKKCKTFPYCNQGDIKSLDIYENDSIKESIMNVSKKLGIDENVIKTIIQYELENSKKINIYSKK